MNTLILGASDKPERFSFRALKLLESNNYETVLVNPNLKKIIDKPVYKSIDEVREDIHTVTVYLNPTSTNNLKESIIKLNPKRVIFNPGSENFQLKKELESNGIICTNACTLIMIDSGTY